MKQPEAKPVACGAKKSRGRLLEAVLAELPESPDRALTRARSLGLARVAEEARAYGLGPLLSHYLPDAFPLPRQERLAVAFRSAQAIRTTVEVVRLLESAGVEVLVLKGAPLATSLYPAGWLRPSSDIDLLTRPRDVDRGIETLKAAGWSLSIGPRQSRLDFAHDVSLVRGRSLVELHYRPSWHFQAVFDVEELFSREGAVELDGQKVGVLGAADGLVHLCVHAASHYFDGVKWLFDLKLATAGPAVPWAEVVGAARKARVATVTGVALAEAVRRIGAAVPEEVVDELLPRRSKLRLARAAQAIPAEYWRTRSAVYDLLLADRLSEEWLLRLGAPPIKRIGRAAGFLARRVGLAG